jgi:hypothetical protein
MLDDTFAEIKPSVVSLGFALSIGWGIGWCEHVGGAEMRAVGLRDHRPPHELGSSEEFEDCGFGRNKLSISRIAKDPMEKVVLLVVMRCKDDVEYDALEALSQYY